MPIIIILVYIYLQLTSVGRLLRCTDTPQEGPFHSGAPLPHGWPNTGTISLNNVSLKYNGHSAMVLNNLTAEIKDREKVSRHYLLLKLDAGLRQRI